MRIRLHADRFLVGMPGGTIDLASGARVTLRRYVVPVPGVSETEWLQECGRQAVRRFPERRSLIDYGMAGSAERFEAFLELTPSVIRRPTRGTRADRADDFSGGVVLQPRAALDRIIEIFDGDSGTGFTTVQLIGPRESGLTTALVVLAREARLRGFLPVAASVLAGLFDRPDLRRIVTPCFASRYLAVLHDDPSLDGHENSAVLARSVLTPEVLGAAGGLVIVATRRRASGLPTISLDPLSREAMMKMIGPAARTIPPRVVRRALDRAAGRPGTFLRNLGLTLGSPRAIWPDRREERLPGEADGGAFQEAPMLARERAEGTYATGVIAFPSGCEIGESMRADPGLDLAARTEPRRSWKQIEHLLCEARAMAARRGRRQAASVAALQLGVLLLHRGRITEACAAFTETISHATSSGLTPLAARAAACLGYAQTDAGQLCEAETVLRAARTVAARAALNTERVLLDLALARCLYWQDRIDEAWILIEPLSCGELEASVPAGAVTTSYVHEGDESLATLLPATGWWTGVGSVDPAVLAGSIGVRVAFAATGPHRAMQIAGNAFARAQAINRPLELALAHYALGVAHAGVGDRVALRNDIAAVVALARRAGAPLLALRARLLGYEASQGAGHDGGVEPRLRYEPDRLPGLLGARVRLALARGSPTDRAAQLRGVVERWIRVSGARRLRADARQMMPADAVADLVGQVLECLHETDHGPAALTKIAGEVARRTRAAGVAIVARRDRGIEVMASFGRAAARAAGGSTGTLAARACDSGDVVRTSQGDTDLALAAPIRHARTIVGAVVCRWSADADVLLDRIHTLVTAAAAALGPAVAVMNDAPPVHPVDEKIPELVGSTPAMLRLREAILKAAKAPFPVLIEGESGSGKELVARAIHTHSDRRSRRFCAVNCAALTDDLLEAELFGHARGAFTGAMTERPGLFEEADGGVLFLDEVSELSGRAQAKLLRVLQEREIRRVGENFPRPVDVRVVGATNRPLRAEVATGRFRQDLLYRLDVIRIVVPPLRERVEDIPLLAARFWARSAERLKTRATLSPASLAALVRHSWPGNVRELQNVIAALAVKAPPYGRVSAALVHSLISSDAAAAPVERLAEARRRIEERVIRSALARAGGHCGQAATELGVTRQGLAKLMRRLGIEKNI